MLNHFICLIYYPDNIKSKNKTLVLIKLHYLQIIRKQNDRERV